MVKFKKKKALLGGEQKKDPKTADMAKSILKEPLTGTVKKINKKKNKIKQEKQKNKKLVPKQFSNAAPTEADTEEALTLDILKQLGGDEEDLKMVEDIKGSDNAEDISPEAEYELKSLLKSLNFKKFKPEDFVVKDAEVTVPEGDGNTTEAKDKKEKSPIEEVKKEEVKEEIKEEEENLLPDSVTKPGF